jgi:hypothetical protein
VSLCQLGADLFDLLPVFLGNVTAFSADTVYDSSSQTLICTSTGGPATSVTWSRDNTPLVVDGTTYQQSQVITNVRTSTYQNRLRIVSKLASLSGTYTCSVGNSKRTIVASVEITSMHSHNTGMAYCMLCFMPCSLWEY